MRELLRVVAALAATCVLVRVLAVGGADRRTAVVLVVTAGVVLCGLVLWSEGPVTAGAVVLSAAYVLSLYFGDVAADPWVPVMAALLVLYVDAADLALAVSPGTPVDRRFARAAVRAIGGRVALASVVSAALVAVAAAPTGGSLLLRALGMLGAAAALSAPVLLLRRGGAPGRGSR